MEYQALKRQVDKLQEENVRLKVALRQLRTQSQHLLTRTKRNTVSRPLLQDTEEPDLCGQQQPDAFSVQLLEKERKTGAQQDWQLTGPQKQKGALTEQQGSIPQRALLQSVGDAASLDTPLKKHVGVDRAHPLEPITVRKMHNNAFKEAEMCQPCPAVLSQPTAAQEADTVNSRRGRVVKTNEYMAWSIDSMDDNIMNFCKDLLLRTKVKEAPRKVTKMSEIIYYEGPECPHTLRTTDGPTEALAPETPLSECHTTISHPESAQDPPTKLRSRLPYLKRLRIHSDRLSTAFYPHQNKHDPTLLPSNEKISHRKIHGVMEAGSNGQKRLKAHLKKVKKCTKSHTIQNSVHKIPSTCELRDDPSCPPTLLPLVRTCTPQTQSPEKPSQGAPGPSQRDQEQHRPLSKPQLALDHTFQLLGSDSWEQKIQGLTRVRRLAQWHSDVLVARLHDVCMAVIQEVQNLRSLVSRVAVATLGDLYLHLQRGMDPELDWTAKVLLQKAGEANSFIRQDVGVAFDHMLRCCTPSRSMKALLNGGLRHQNVAVRECAARQLQALVQSMGTARLLCCQKDIMSSFLSAVRRLPQDASQEVRRCGQQILGVLRAHQDFQKKMKVFPLK